MEDSSPIAQYVWEQLGFTGPAPTPTPVPEKDGYPEGPLLGPKG